MIELPSRYSFALSKFLHNFIMKKSNQIITLSFLALLVGGLSGCSPEPSALPIDQWRRIQIADKPDDTTRRLFVLPGDLNGDGHLDIVAGREWFANPGMLGGEWTAHTIGEGFKNLALVYDFDSDGDLDLLGTNAELRGADFALATNDGQGNFIVDLERVPSGRGDFIQGVAVIPNAAGDEDVILSWHRDEVGLESLSPREGGRWELGLLTTETLHEQISTGDIDGDGDLDLLLGNAWLENRGVEEWALHAIGEIGDENPKAVPDRNALVDVNGDGRLDAIVSLENGQLILWYEQPEGDPRSEWTRHVLGHSPGQGFSMGVADYDLDGDPDVVIGEHRNPGEFNRLLLFENVDAASSWTEHVIDDGVFRERFDHHDGTVPVDIDGDGDIDLVSVGFHNASVWIFENLAKD